MVPAGLLRLHQHGLFNVLVVMPDRDRRLAAAAEFHRASVLRDGPMVVMDAASEEARIEQALIGWSFGASAGGVVHPLWAVARGTLVLDRVTRLRARTQELLHDLILRRPSAAGFDWCGRLIAGSDESPERAVARGAFSAALLDSLDKVRVDDLAHRIRGAA